MLAYIMGTRLWQLADTQIYVILGKTWALHVHTDLLRGTSGRDMISLSGAIKFFVKVESQ